MNYDIAVIADIHWDALDPKKQYHELQFFNAFVERVEHLDLVVIAGDVFDTKILLNSKTSLKALQWMSELVEICKKRNTKIRIIKGTNSHDNNQLDAFNGYDNGTDFFHIFRKCTSEETLPGMQCLYCPDEVMTQKEWEDAYIDLLYGKIYDAVFFHGSFDIVLPEIINQESEFVGAKGIAFKYSHFKEISHVMVGGHWHDGSASEGEHMYYTRSYSRWSYGEMNPKGFIYLNYDTEDKSYCLQRVENPYADLYMTYSVDTRSMPNVDSYQGLIQKIHEDLQDPKVHIRISIRITDTKIENQNAIDMLRRTFIDQTRRVKIHLRNEMKEEIRKRDQERTERIRDRFDFVRDKNNTTSQIIQKFIHETKDVDISLEDIDRFVTKYMR